MAAATGRPIGLPRLTATKAAAATKRTTVIVVSYSSRQSAPDRPWRRPARAETTPTASREYHSIASLTAAFRTRPPITPPLFGLTRLRAGVAVSVAEAA